MRRPRPHTGPLGRLAEAHLPHPTTASSIGLTLALCVTVTMAAAFSPGIQFAYRQPGLHIAIETAATLIAGLAAFLVAGRFARSHRLDDLLLAAALTVIALTNLVVGALPSTLLSLPLDSGWVWAQLGGLLLGSMIFAAASFAPPVRLTMPEASAMALAVMVVGVAAVAAMTVAVIGAAPIPTAVTERGPEQLEDVWVSLIVSATMLSFAVAAVGLYYRSAETRDAMLGFFAAGAVASTFARLDFFLFPSVDARWIYIADLMRLLAYVLMAAGAAYEIRGYWWRMSEAAVLEERRRLARDLHDGLAQELAFISRLARDADADAGEIQASADRALDESRRAIAALTRPLDEPLDQALAQAVEDVAARGGKVPLLQLELPGDVRVSGEVQETLIRVACEAVSNATRHGHADTVRVRVDDRDGLELLVLDDGVGFDTAELEGGRGRFGIIGMRERVESLGGRFAITSSASTGTRVQVTL